MTSLRRRAFGVTVVIPVVLAIGSMAARAQAPAEAPDFYSPDPALRAYIDDALSRNPSLEAARARSRAARWREPQVTALPEPTVSLTQAIRSVETRVGPQIMTVMVNQSFPWFGRLDLQGQMAEYAARAEERSAVAHQRDIIARIKLAYYSLGYVDAALRVTEEERSLLEYYEQLAQTRYATGQGLQQGVIRLQAEITRVLNRLELLRQQRETLAARLNTLRSRGSGDPVPSIDALVRPPLEPDALDADALYALAETHREELQSAAALIEREEQAVALARTDSRPSFSVGAGFVHVGRRDDPAALLQPPPDDGRTPLTVTVGLTLPLRREKYAASVSQAAEELVARRHQEAGLRDDIAYAIRDAIVRLDTLDDQIVLFETVLVPQAEAVLRATEAAYETAQLGVLDLLDGERTLLDVRLAQARQHADYLIALAQLERAIGTAFPRDGSQP